jgi:hypothetical protein
MRLAQRSRSRIPSSKSFLRGPLVRLSLLAAMFALATCVLPAASTGADSSTKGGPTGPSAGQLASSRECTWSACHSVLEQVKEGAGVTAVPSNLTPSLQTAMADIHFPANPQLCGANGTLVEELGGYCFLINRTATGPRIALLGDSHSEMWSSAVADIAAQQGDPMLLLTKYCSMSMVGFWNPLTSTPFTSCTTWKQSAIQRLAQFNPRVVIVTTGDVSPLTDTDRPMSQQEFSHGLATTLRDVSAPGRRVILLGDIDYPVRFPAYCLAAHQTNVRVCDSPTSVAVRAPNQAAEAAAAKAAGAQYVDVIPWLCTRTTCPAIIDGIEVYQNLSHITSTYGVHLEPVLTQALGL